MKKRDARKPPGRSIWNQSTLDAMVKELVFNQGKRFKSTFDYYRYISAFVLLTSGFALLCEHLITWGGFDRTWGHEGVGVILILLAYVVGLRNRD